MFSERCFLLWDQNFNSLPRIITNLKNEKTQFKEALKKFLNAHSFYSVDELFTCTDDMYCWLCDCVNVSYTVIFLLFVCLWHIPHPIVLWLSRIYGMYICMHVCMHNIVGTSARERRQPSYGKTCGHIVSFLRSWLQIHLPHWILKERFLSNCGPGIKYNLLSSTKLYLGKFSDLNFVKVTTRIIIDLIFVLP